MTTRPPQQQPPRRSAAIVLLSLLVIAVAAALILTFRHGRDQAIYALVARSMWQGGMPYRDAWDFKPPGIFLVYAAARGLFGAAPWGIRVIEVAGLGATVLGMRALARHWWGDGRIGLFAGAMYALVHAQLEFWHSAQPETFGGMLSIAGLCAALLGRRPAWQRQLLAGALFGAAGLLKPPLAGGGAALALWFVLRDFQRPDSQLPVATTTARKLRAAVVPAAWVTLGGALPFVLTLLWFAAGGALPELFHTLFVFTPGYTALGWAGPQGASGGFVGLLLHATKDWLLGYSSLLCAGLGLGLLAGRRYFSRAGVGLLFAMIGVQLLGVAVQAKFFAYHYAGLWPLTALLAALGWWSCWRWAERRGVLERALFFTTIFAVAALRSATRNLQPFHQRVVLRAAALTVDRHIPEAFEHLASVADVDALENRAVATALANHIASDESVFVWGFEPQIYDMAGRRCASRFVYNVPQRAAWQRAWARDTLMAELRRAPPAAVVVARGDPLPMVTGDDGDSAAALTNFEALRSMLADDYRAWRRIGDFELYLRRDLPPDDRPRGK